MQEKKRYFLLLWSSSVLGVLTFIFANSLLPAEASGAQSGEVYGVLQTLLHFLPFLTHELVRTFAHAAEFALLGAHFAFLPCFFTQKPKPLCAALLLSGLLFAFFDEGIQHFVPGRAVSLGDVFTDSIGYLAGLLFFLVALRIYYEKRRKVQKTVFYATRSYVRLGKERVYRRSSDLV